MSTRACESAFDVFRRGIDLFRSRELIEIKAKLTPRPLPCRYCRAWNYHLKDCARSVRLARARAVFERRPETGQTKLSAARVIDDVTLRWFYVLELAIASSPTPGRGAMP